MTMKGGSGSKTAAPTAGAAKNKGRLKSLKSSKSMSSVDRRGSDDSPDVDTGAKILQNQRKKILAVNAFEKSKQAGKAAKASKSQSRSGSREGRVAPKSAASKTAGKLMAAASKSTAMASSASSTTSNSTGTKNVTASGAKPRMFVRHNSTPAVIPLDKKGGTRKSALKSGGGLEVEAAGRPQRKKSASAENLPEAHKSAKSVRIDDVVEVSFPKVVQKEFASDSAFPVYVQMGHHHAQTRLSSHKSFD